MASYQKRSDSQHDGSLYDTPARPAPSPSEQAAATLVFSGEIYIHSKLMFVDDVYTTLGSANLNARSMAGDSELNICTEEWAFTKAARKRVWGNLAGEDLHGGEGMRKDMELTLKSWQQRMDANKRNKLANRPPVANSFIHPFEDPRGEPLVRLA